MGSCIAANKVAKLATMALGNIPHIIRSVMNKVKQVLDGVLVKMCSFQFPSCPFFKERGLYYWQACIYIYIYNLRASAFLYPSLKSIFRNLYRICIISYLHKLWQVWFGTYSEQDGIECWCWREFFPFTAVEQLIPVLHSRWSLHWCSVLQYTAGVCSAICFHFYFIW